MREASSIEIGLLCALLCVISFLFGNAIGHAEATRKEKMQRVEIDQKMERLGFCEWVKVSSFAHHCAAKPKETGNADD